MLTRMPKLSVLSRATATLTRRQLLSSKATVRAVPQRQQLRRPFSITRSLAKAAETPAAELNSGGHGKPAVTARGWRRYAHYFREAPATHITSFAILHELTAILPFPVIYYTLHATGFEFPIPENMREEGENFARRLVKRYGWSGSQTPDDAMVTAGDVNGPGPTTRRDVEGGLVDATSRIFVNLAVTYAIVKALLPVRIAASVAMTPWFARTVVGPVLGAGRRASQWIKSRVTA